MKAVFRGLLLLASVLHVLGHPPLKSEEKHDSLGDCRFHGDHPGHAAVCGPSEHKPAQHQFAQHHPQGKANETAYTQHFVTNPIGLENSSSSSSSNVVDTPALQGGSHGSAHSGIDAHKHSPGSDSAHDNYQSGYHTASHSSPHTAQGNTQETTHHDHEHSGSDYEHCSEHGTAHHEHSAHGSHGATYGVGGNHHHGEHSSSHGKGHGYDESHHHAGDGHDHGGSHGNRPWDQESASGHDYGHGSMHPGRHDSLHKPQHHDDDDLQEWEGPSFEYMDDTELEHTPSPNKKPLVHH